MLAERRERLGVTYPFVVVLDWAPVHIGYEFRKAFYDKYGIHKSGVLVYVPPNTTSKLQTPDLSVFWAFKAAYKAAHTTLVHTTAYEDTDRTTFLWSSKTCRAAAYQAVCQAGSSIRVQQSVEELFARLFPDSEIMRDQVVNSFHQHEAVRAKRGQRRPYKTEAFCLP